MWLALLQYLLYCNSLGWSLQYLWGSAYIWKEPEKCYKQELKWPCWAVFYRQVVSRSQLYFFTYFCLFGIYICFYLDFKCRTLNDSCPLIQETLSFLVLLIILYFIDLSSYQHYFILFLWVLFFSCSLFFQLPKWNA